MTLPQCFTKKTFRLVATFLFSVTMLSANTQTQAGEITSISWFSGVASVAGEIIGPLLDPNNDNTVGPSLNELLVTQKDYTAIGPVDLVFTVEPTGGTTEYVINEGVSNSTGLDWSGYRIELGFGVGTDFVLSTASDDLNFDSPDFDSGTDFSAFFTSVTENEDDIFATGGLFPNLMFTFPMFQFSIDVPDGITEFTLRQRPIAALVPEPSTALLASLGFAVLFTRTRRKK